MSITKPASRFFNRRGLSLLLIPAALFTLAASSPQCTRTTDRVFSPRFSPTGDPDTFGECVSACAHTAAAARQAEAERFTAEMKACGDDESCKQGKAAEHVERLAVITHEFRVCVSICHNQGGGTGGN